MSTFEVVCVAMGLVVVLETVFTFLRAISCISSRAN